MSYFRHPKTQSELRQRQSTDGVKVRARYIPTYYADIPRSTEGLRTWKHFRATQYKVA